MHAIPEELREEARKSGNRSAWIALAVIVLVVIAMIVLLSSMPDVS